MSLFRPRREKLIEAVVEDDTSKVRGLLERGTDPNARGDYEIPTQGPSDAPQSISTTALMYAAANGLTDVVELLLDHGADVNARDQSGTTALLCAARSGHAQVAAVLIDKGSDVNARDQQGWTPLLVATVGDHTDIVKILLAEGADPNVESNERMTSLNYAMEHGSDVMADLLREAGARD